MSERIDQQEITFVVETVGLNDIAFKATRKGDRSPDEDGRVPGGWASGHGETELEAIENCVRTLREDE